MYQVFISFKNSFNGSTTEDSLLATQLFNALTQAGIKAFYSNSTLSEQGVSEYKKAIDDALNESKILILVATNADFVETRWVRYEWDTFLQEILSNRKNQGKIFTYLKNIYPSNLPLSLRSLQSFSASDDISQIVKYIKNSLENEVDRTVQAKKYDLIDGIKYYYGLNCQIDYRYAYDIFMQNLDSDMALFLLGEMYYYGNCVQKDYIKACDYYREGAKLKNIFSIFKLGECYKKEKGVEFNFSKHDELKKIATSLYNSIIESINDVNNEYDNNIVFIGKNNRNVVSKEAIMALEIKYAMEAIGQKIELFDVNIENLKQVSRVDEIKQEKTMFIFSSIESIHNPNMENMWKKMFEDFQISNRLAITYFSKIQVHDIPSYLRKSPFIMRDHSSINKIVDFYCKGGK